MIAPQRRLRLYAHRTDDGEVRGIFLLRDGEALALWEESAPPAAAQPLPVGALPAIFTRYGKPLDEGPRAEVAPTLVSDDPDDAPLEVPLGPLGSAMLRRFRFLPFGWVFPADYLLWEQAGEPPLCAPAPLVTSALSALARAAQKSIAASE